MVKRGLKHCMKIIETLAKKSSMNNQISAILYHNKTGKILGRGYNKKRKESSNNKQCIL